MDDLISRQAVIDICNSAIDLWHGQLGEGIVIAVKKKIKELPSAQPDSKETSSTHKALDTISRQAAIAEIARWIGYIDEDMINRIQIGLNRLPSVQPTEASCWGCNCQKMERLKEQKTFSEMVHLHDAETHEERTETHACDCISRQAAIDAHYEYCNKHPDAGFPVWSLKILEDLPHAQPEHTNSWCIDCKEYDQERHCCPRWNRVIRQTLKDAQPEPQWIPCSERLSDEEVLCCDTRGEMIIGYPYPDEESNTGFSAEFDDVFMIDCAAWMPLPKSYRAERITDA